MGEDWEYLFPRALCIALSASLKVTKQVSWFLTLAGPDLVPVYSDLVLVEDEEIWENRYHFVVCRKPYEKRSMHGLSVENKRFIISMSGPRLA